MKRLEIPHEEEDENFNIIPDDKCEVKEHF